jgi:hypothetical protein
MIVILIPIHSRSFYFLEYEIIKTLIWFQYLIP